MPKFTKESSAFKGKCYFCDAEIMVPTTWMEFDARYLSRLLAQAN